MSFWNTFLSRSDDTQQTKRESELLKSLEGTNYALIEAKKIIESQRLQIADHKSRLADFSTQIEELRASKPMTPQEWAMFQNQSAFIAEQQEKLDALALWLRHNRKSEIARGDHAGLSFQNTIIMYLSRGLALEKGTSIPGIKRDGEGEGVN